MRKVLIVFLITSGFLSSQSVFDYKEINLGIYAEDIIFPGMSFLWGETYYVNDILMIDYQLGIALPTLITGKIGLGLGNNKNSCFFGVRPWPTSIYLQYTKNNKWLFTFERMVPHSANFMFDSSEPIILTIGYRWKKRKR